MSHRMLSHDTYSIARVDEVSAVDDNGDSVRLELVRMRENVLLSGSRHRVVVVVKSEGWVDHAVSHGGLSSKVLMEKCRKKVEMKRSGDAKSLKFDLRGEPIKRILTGLSIKPLTPFFERSDNIDTLDSPLQCTSMRWQCDTRETISLQITHLLKKFQLRLFSHFFSEHNELVDRSYVCTLEDTR